LDRVLGLLILTVYVAAVIALAGLVTLAVIKIFPTKDRPSGPTKSSEDGTGQGRLFRRAKRGEATS
jgi:hypothetical protein